MAKPAAAYKVLDSHAPRRATDADIANAAMDLWTDIGNRTPVDTGTLLRGWQVVKVKDSLYHVVNEVYYARFVEFGTSDSRAVPAVGQALASARRRYGRGRRR